MTTIETLPEWQRGYELEYLKRFTAVAASHDEGMLHGRFGATSERTIAEFLELGGLLCDDWQQPSALLLYRRAGSERTMFDFSGAPRATVAPGDLSVKKVAGDFGWLREQLDGLAAQGERLWIETWAEHEQDRELLSVLGRQTSLGGEPQPARYALTKIRASSEIVTVSFVGDLGLLSPIDPLPDFERPSLCQLPGHFDGQELLEELRGLSYADHYSVYGKGKSWGALSLRGYAPPGELCDEDFIIKPGEMSKKWKGENPEKLSWEPAWSELGMSLAEQLGPLLPDAELDRVRLMRLAPGGGELRRHADITDREAGMRDGMVARLHYPLRSNPQVLFNSWSLEGERQEAHMQEGSCWYLDVRKPHTAVNGGEEDRIHLVVDARANEELRGRIMAGA